MLAQLQAAKELAGVEVLQASVVAYEPVWAIGTGVAATLQDVAQMHGAIKAALREWGGDFSALRRERKARWRVRVDGAAGCGWCAGRWCIAGCCAVCGDMSRAAM